MSAIIIFFCAGLLVYWLSRMMMLLYGSPGQTNEILDCDLWWGRRFLMALRAMFVPPALLAG